jgi:RimJ/RimL family protein N-acetyltransferase
MMNSILDLGRDERRSIAGWIGERPETVIAVAALQTGNGRVWIDGDQSAPTAVLVESALLPGEPQGFGDAASVVRLLERMDEWSCVEVDSRLADAISHTFENRWGIAQTATDIVHVLSEECIEYSHQAVRPLTAPEAFELPAAVEGMLPDRRLVASAAELGRFFVAIDNSTIVGWGGSLAAGGSFGDVGVRVAPAQRRQGLATACASSVCSTLQAEGLVPVWGSSSENAASLAVAHKLGFEEVARLSYLVRSI